MNNQPPTGHIFVGGAGRSGTTLMRVLLDAHRNICCGPEMKVLPAVAGFYVSLTSMPALMQGYGNSLADMQNYFRQFIDNLSANFRRDSGKPRWAEKTPHNVAVMAGLGTIFPDARFIHMIRDGRDVACSLIGMDWTEAGTGQKVEYIRTIGNAARYWNDVILAARQEATNPILAGRVVEVRYEALVADTEGVMRKVLEFLGESWDPAILDAHKKSRAHEPHESSTDQATKPIYTSALARWKRDMTPADKSAFKAQAGALLKSLGYARDDAW
jgi:hypothetical protein